MKFLFTVLFLIGVSYPFNFISFYSFSQNQIHFWDYHKEKVLEARLHPSEKYIVTRDDLGKVILWETNGFKYLKTLFKPTIHNVTGMTWVRDGNGLAVTQNRSLSADPLRRDNTRSSLIYKDSVSIFEDSLFIFPVFDTVKSVKMQASLDFINPSNKKYDILAQYKKNEAGIYLVSTDSTYNGFNIRSPYPHHYAADINNKKKEILIGSSNINIYDPPLLTFMNTENYTTIKSIGLEFKPRYILYLELENKYLIIGSKTSEKQLYYTFFDPSKLELDELISIGGETSFLSNEFVHNTYKFENGHYRIVIRASSTYETIFDYSNGELKPIKNIFNTNLVQKASFFIPKKDVIGFFKYQSLNQQKTKMEFELWDYSTENKIKQFEMTNRPLAEASFLPDGSWVVTGRSEKHKQFLKYFPKKEPLNNKFSAIYLLDHISDKFNITSIYYYHFDPSSGKIVFTGFQDKSRFFVYDIKNDRIDRIIEDPKKEYKNPIGFSDSLSRIIVSDGFDNTLIGDGFYNVRLIDKDKTSTINKPVTVSLISNNGQHLLVKDTSNTVSIYDISKTPKEIYSRNFNQDYLTDFKVNNSLGFSFTASNFSNGFSINSYSLVLDKKDVIEDKVSGYKIHSLFKQDDYVVALIGLGNSRDLIINLNDSTILHKNFYAEGYTPYSVSMNSKESRLMLNNEEGTTTFINLKSKKQIGTMAHFNERDQVIVSKEGYFSSNIDVSRILYMDNGEDNLTWINDRNSPADVLHLFGSEDEIYKDFLNNVKSVHTNQKQTLEITPENNEVKIKSVKFPELGDKFSTNRQSVLFNVLFEGNHKQIAAVEVKINKGLTYLFKKSKNEFTIDNNSIQFKINLTTGDNNIEVRLITSENNTSNIFSKLLINDNLSKGNLYFLSIGVSNYQDSIYDLVFADKDAMDLALLYGDSSSIDTKKYKMKFYANKYNIVGENIQFDVKSIASLSEGYAWESNPRLYALDSMGRYWAERKDKSFYLWDFKQGIRKKIHEEEEDNSHLNANYLMAEDNSGFFFFVRKPDSYDDQAYFYDIEKQKSFKTKVPDNLISCLTKNKFLVYDIDYYSVNKTFYFKEIEFEHDSIISSTTKDFSISCPEKYQELNLIDVNKDFTKFLFDYKSESLVIAEKTKDSLRINKLKNLKYESSSDYKFNDNYIISYSVYDDFYRKIDLNTMSVEQIDLNSNIVGINYHNSAVYKVYKNEQLDKNKVSSGISGKDNLQVYSNNTPYSFKEKHIRCLTDEEATQKSILNAIESFFKDLSPNDQAILFMAGHGVLDSSNRFLFAPHDMNFSNPTQKGISYNKIIESIKVIPTANKLVLFDACHSGNIFSNVEESSYISFNSNTSKSRGAKRVNRSKYNSWDIQKASDYLFDKVPSSTGITVLSASSGDDVAYEGLENLSNGNFTASIISVLMNYISSDNTFSLKEDRLGINLTEEVLYEINEKIITTSHNKQIPNIREINKYSQLFLW